MTFKTKSVMIAGGPPSKFESEGKYRYSVSILIAPQKITGKVERVLCPICGREATEEGYCKYHKEASDNILKKYAHWKRATGISWKGYLSQIAKNPLSGEWTREVAQHMIKLETKNNVKSS